MLLNLIRWLRGYVVFEGAGKFPERFMNLCIHQGRFIFDASPVSSKGKFTASLLVSDYKCIRSLARRSGVRLKVKKKYGLPFIFSRYKGRKGLFYGALAYLFIIIFMQSFVWTVEVRGLTTLSVTEMEHKLQEKGVYVGSFKGSKNLHAIERSIMQEVDAISWMSINLIGTKAEVEIKEKEQKPHIIESGVPCNIKACTDGLIVSMDIKKGSTEIPVGSAVKKGQLIVSGVVKNATENISFVHADAKVMAQTKQHQRFFTEKSYCGKTATDVIERKNLDFFGVSFPFSLASVSGEYTSRPKQYRLMLNDTAVPVGVTVEECTVYSMNTFNPDRESAEEMMKKDEALYRLFALKDCEKIKTATKIQENENLYIYEVSYDCVENIAVKEKFIVN